MARAGFAAAADSPGREHSVRSWQALSLSLPRREYCPACWTASLAGSEHTGRGAAERGQCRRLAPRPASLRPGRARAMTAGCGTGSVDPDHATGRARRAIESAQCLLPPEDLASAASAVNVAYRTRREAKALAEARAEGERGRASAGRRIYLHIEEAVAGQRKREAERDSELRPNLDVRTWGGLPR
jgi:hypothetical protein